MLIDSTLLSCPIGNPIELLYNNLGSDIYIKLNILQNSDLLFSGVYYQNSDNNVYIDLQPILKGVINTKQLSIDTSTTYYEIPNSVATLSYQIYESSLGTYNTAADASGSFKILPFSLKDEDWLSLYVDQVFSSEDYILNKFDQNYPSDVSITNYTTYFNSVSPKQSLRNAPLTVQMYANFDNSVYTTQKVTYVNNSDVSSGPFTVKDGYYSSNTTIVNSNITPKLYVVDVSSLSYAIFDITNLDVSVYRPTNGRRLVFELVDGLCGRNTYQLYYQNRNFGVDWIIMQGNNIKSYDIESNQYQSNWRQAGVSNISGNNSSQINNRYVSKTTTSWILNSDILDDTEYNALEDIISAPCVWLYDNQTDTTYAVEIVDTNFSFKQYKFDKIFNFQIKVKKQLQNIRI